MGSKKGTGEKVPPYVVAIAHQPEDVGTEIERVQSGFPSSRDARKWSKSYGTDGTQYTIMRVCAIMEVETITNKRVKEVPIRNA